MLLINRVVEGRGKGAEPCFCFADQVVDLVAVNIEHESRSLTVLFSDIFSFLFVYKKAYNEGGDHHQDQIKPDFLPYTFQIAHVFTLSQSIQE